MAKRKSDVTRGRRRPPLGLVRPTRGLVLKEHMRGVFRLLGRRGPALFATTWIVTALDSVEIDARTSTPMVKLVSREAVYGDYPATVWVAALRAGSKRSPIGTTNRTLGPGSDPARSAPLPFSDRAITRRKTYIACTNEALARSTPPAVTTYADILQRAKDRDAARARGFAVGQLVVSRDAGRLCFRVARLEWRDPEPWPVLWTAAGAQFDGYWFRLARSVESALEIVDWKTFRRRGKKASARGGLPIRCATKKVKS